MIIQYQPTGNIVSIPEQRPVVSAMKFVVEPTLSTPYGGDITNLPEGGSFRAYNAKANAATISWLGAGGGVVDEWEMDTKEAAELAVNTTIPTALAAEDSFLLLGTDGYPYIPS